MGKITIYIKLVDGVLMYRDSEKDHGKTITTVVNPGDKITWALDKDSGISDLTGINIVGTPDFFSKGPCKKATDKWTAKVASKASGEVTYYIYYTAADSQAKAAKVTMKAGGGVDPEGPTIKIPT